MKTMIKIALAAVLVAAAGSAHAGTSVMNGLNSSNGLNIQNGLRSINGLNIQNGLRVVNGLNIQNGLRSINGLNIQNGLIAWNGLNGSRGAAGRLVPGLWSASGIDPALSLSTNRRTVRK